MTTSTLANVIQQLLLAEEEKQRLIAEVSRLNQLLHPQPETDGVTKTEPKVYKPNPAYDHIFADVYSRHYSCSDRMCGAQDCDNCNPSNPDSESITESDDADVEEEEVEEGDPQ